MNAPLFWKVLAIQAVAVIAVFAVLVALPLPDGFFERWGIVTGPLAWLGCALVTARVLGLPQRLVLAAAAGAGVAGGLVSLVVSHAAGMPAALVMFAAWCSLTSASRPPRVFNH